MYIKLERNDLCPCNSGLKYKKCYEVHNEKCGLFLKERYQEESKSVQEYFAQIAQELNETTKVLLQIKSTTFSIVVLYFVCMEVYAKCWSIFLNKTEGNKYNKKRICEWLSEFVFTDSNEEFATEKELWKQFSPDEIYKLRCSALHFFAVDLENENKHVSIINGSANSPNIKKLREIYMDSCPEKDLIFIDIKQILRLFNRGFKKSFIAISNDPDVLRMHRLFDRIEKEGAIKMPI
jgi:hypothetical protein